MKKMNLTIPLAKAALLMILFLIPGYILRRTKVINEQFAFSLSQLLVYVAVPAMLISSHLRAYDSSAMKSYCVVAGVTLLVVLVFYFLTDLIFPKSIPEEKRKVLRFGSIFSNTGNMGIPLIIYTLGSEYALYVQAAVLVFNCTVFSLGRYLYCGDRKHISFRGCLINPGTIPGLLGLFLYVTGIGGKIAAAAGNPGTIGFAAGLFYDAVMGLTDMVAPLTMIIIGVRLAEVDLKDAFTDRGMYLQMFLRLFVVPSVTALICMALCKAGVIPREIYALSVIISSTPCAALTTVMAELYGCDSVYGSKLVAVSTVLSIITMPIVITIFG